MRGAGGGIGTVAAAAAVVTPAAGPSAVKARVAEDVVRKQGGERFSVLYPADFPKSPIEPKPLKIMALAIVAGLVLGAGAALGREFLDRSVYDTRALQNEFEVPVLGEIPRIPA